MTRYSNELDICEHDEVAMTPLFSFMVALFTKVFGEHMHHLFIREVDDFVQDL